MKYARYLTILVLVITPKLHASLPTLSADAGGLVLYVGDANEDTLEQLAEQVAKPQLIGQVCMGSEKGLLAARRAVAQEEAEGQLSISTFNGQALPVISSLANYIILPESTSVPQEEILRALAPRGIAYIQDGSKWKQVVKPVPEDIDDWTHALYNPANTVVSKDMKVGPPRRLQWMSGPGWSRSHEHMVSFNAMVSDGGIVFYIVDLGSRSAIALPARWTLIARDAFNGKELWRKSMPSWMNHMFPLKTGPTQIQRKLVAVDGKVYLPLGATAPVSQLDGRTGKVLRTYEGTENVDEILIDGDQMIVHMAGHVASREGYTHDKSHVWAAGGDARKRFGWSNEVRKITSVNPETGETHWTHESPCVAMTVTMGEDAIYFFDGVKAVAVSREDGTRLWESEKLVVGDQVKHGELGTGYAPTMLTYGGAVVFQIRENRQPGKIFGFDPKTGKTLWTQEPQESGHHSPEDLMPLQGLLWSGGTARLGKGGGTYQGINPLTGEVEKEFPVNVRPSYWFHQRCYRAKGTEKYIIPAATGTEYIDPKTGNWDLNHWVRGGCLYGVMPANGMTYVPPNPCACFSETQLRTLGAFAPVEDGVDVAAIDPNGRFVKGPAFDEVEDLPAGTEDWPMYRRDVERTGATKSKIPSELKEKWRLPVAGRISPPVSAHGLVLVSAVDDRQVVAVHQKNGKEAWRYPAGGRVDSPPTIYRGRVLFGAKDGWVTCLRLKDGEVVWKYRAAPQNKYLIADEQVESVWPLNGSLLIAHDRLYALAGRSMFVDGGLSMSVLNPLTGELINEVRYDDVDPITGESMQLRTSGSSLPASRVDILTAKGDTIYLGSQKIDKDGERLWPETKGSAPGEKSLTYNKGNQGGDDVHLLSLSGFLDDSWFHRTYWLYGITPGGGWGGWMSPMKMAPAGRILAVGDDTVYGYGRKPTFIRQSSVTEYQIFSTKKGQFSLDKVRAMAGKKPDLVMGPEQKAKFEELRKAANEAGKKYGKRSSEAVAASRAFSAYRSKMNQLPINKENTKKFRASRPNIADWKTSLGFDDSKSVMLEYDWRELDPKIMVRALTLAGDVLVAAGPADVLDETSLYGKFNSEENREKLLEQEAAFNGERGGHMWVMDTKTGKHLAELELDSVPVFDGIAVANGNVLLSQKNGDLVLFGE